MKRGLIYLWTGEGAGKTTSALGVALRAVGHGKKVVIVQFLKGQKNIGEYKIARRLKQNYEIRQFGTKNFVDPKRLKPADYERAGRGLEFARKKLKEKPFLMILDEMNLVARGGLLTKKEILGFLKKVPKQTTVYVTGRYAPRWLMDAADFVTEIRNVKHPFARGLKATKGIEY